MLKVRTGSVCAPALLSHHFCLSDTFTTHTWVARTSTSGTVVAEYVGDDAIITITTNRFEVTPGRNVTQLYSAVKGEPEWGVYAIRGEIYGITIWV